MVLQQELQAALAPTPIDDIDARRHRGVWHSWFQASGKYSSVSLHTEVSTWVRTGTLLVLLFQCTCSDGQMLSTCMVQVRNRAYARVMAAGLSGWGRAWLRLRLLCEQLAVWRLMCWLAVLESLSVRRIY